MSTLTVVRKGKSAAIASDSLFCQGSIKVTADNKRNHHKIHKFQNAYIGFTGWSVFHNVFESVVEEHPNEIHLESRQQIFKTFRRLHVLLKEEYHIVTTEDKDQPIESSQWDCLIICPSGIFQVGSYREVSEYDRFWADGTGTRFALGAMHSVYEFYETAEEIARAGVEASCALDDGSAPPIQSFTIKLKK
jgi:ATP-dependent protease HslVU (ClpYQ) peptidase subunit